MNEQFHKKKVEINSSKIDKFLKKTIFVVYETLLESRKNNYITFVLDYLMCFFQIMYISLDSEVFFLHNRFMKMETT